MEKKKHKSGSETQRAIRSKKTGISQAMQVCCRFYATANHINASLATNNQEAKNDSDGDDAVTCELQDQGEAILNVKKNTNASFLFNLV